MRKYRPIRRANNLAKVLIFEREMITKEKRDKEDCKLSEGGVEVPMVPWVHTRSSEVEESITGLWENCGKTFAKHYKEKKPPRNTPQQFHI